MAHRCEIPTVQALLDVMGASLPEADRAVLTAEEGRDFLEGTQHALSGTVDGWVTRAAAVGIALTVRPPQVDPNGRDRFTPPGSS